MSASRSERRILIINIFGIGDVLFTTPLISSIKAHLPRSHVGYVCNRRALEVLKDNTKIDRIFVYEKDEYRDLAKISRWQSIEKFRSFLKEIKEDRYDTVLDLSLNSWACFLTWALGIRRRVGFNYKNRSPLLTAKIPMAGFEGRHVIEHYLSLLPHIGIPAVRRDMEVFVNDGDYQWARDVLARNGVGVRTLLVGLAPGGGVSWGKDVVYRRWPPERHAALADKVVEKFSAKVILLGDPSEEGLQDQVMAAMKHPAVPLIGKTTIGQYLALLSRCQLVIVNDGGPLHMAVAAGARTVSLIGPVDEKVYGPYPPQGHGVVTKDIDCRPCYHHFHRAECRHIGCLQDITVEEVFAKVDSMLETGKD